MIPDLKRGERLNLDGYDGQRTILLEDFDGQMEYRTLLRMLDIYNCDFHTKGGMVAADWNHVIITSNIAPQNWYPNDKDPWFYEPNKVGPLQRRLSVVLRAEGIYPDSFAINEHGDKVSFDNLEKRADIYPAVPAAGPSVPAGPQPVPAVRSVPAAGPAPEFVPASQPEFELNDLMDGDELDALLQSAEGSLHASVSGDPEDETDAILFGDDGDSEVPGDWTHF